MAKIVVGSPSLTQLLYPGLGPAMLDNIGGVWPLSTCGIDFVGPLKAKGRFTHIFIVVDKFTKWVEVKHAASITAAKVVEFIRQIMYILSLIMGLNLLRGSSRTFVQTQASKSIMPQCHTRRAIVRQNAQMA
jgi:hypothetical protein